MNKKVAITGAGGFIGCRLVTGLQRLGWHVHAITSRPERIPRAPRVNVVSCQWTRSEIDTALKTVGSIPLWVHAASRIDFEDHHALELYRDNVDLSHHLFQVLSHLDLRTRMIYLSTASVYGRQQIITPATVPEPDTHYGMSKLLSEYLCQVHLADRSLILRLAGVWGHEDEPKLFINRCLKEAEKGMPLLVHGDGADKRNYIWVEDLASIIDVAYAQGWKEVEHIASQETLSVRDMVFAIADYFNVKVQYSLVDKTTEDRVIPVSEKIQTTSFRKALKIEMESLLKTER